MQRTNKSVFTQVAPCFSTRYHMYLYGTLFFFLQEHIFRRIFELIFWPRLEANLHFVGWKRLVSTLLNHYDYAGLMVTYSMAENKFHMLKIW